MKRIACLSVALFLLAPTIGVNCLAAPPKLLPTPSEPGAFIEHLGQRAIKLLGDKTATEQQQRSGFRALLREGFATRAIGFFVIGKYRRSSSQSEINEFVATFENYIVELYSSQFRNYSGQSFQVAKVQATSRPSDFIVTTNILRANGELIFKVAFQVRQRRGKPSKILDVKIKGVSMILAQRDEFTAFISRNDGKLRALIEVLKERIGSLTIKRQQTDNSSAEPMNSNLPSEGDVDFKTPKIP